MKEFWNSLSRGKQIALSATASHFLILFILTIHHFATNQNSSKKPMIVHTVQQVSPVKTFSQPKAASRSKGKTQNVSSASPKKQPAREISKSKTTKQKNVSSSLNELTKSLETLSSLPEIPRSSSALAIPKSIEKRSLAQVEQSTDHTYAESLVLILQNTLDLPEFGEVKAILELTPDGSLQRFEIVETKSQKNAEFLKKRLPELTFPCFNGTDRKHLTLVFRNVEDR